MKKRFAIIIVITAIIGLLSNVVHGIFFEEDNINILNGIRLFKYFTLQSNLIVLIYFLCYSFGNFNKNKIFNKVFGGVLIYITTTFLVYFILLEPLLSPVGLNFVGSLFNHYITPILVIGFFYHFRHDFKFEFKDIKFWIIYPIIYLVFLIVNGLFTNDYIYPFFQVSEIGVIGLIISVIINVLIFLLMSFTLVKIVSKK